MTMDLHADQIQGFEKPVDLRLQSLHLRKFRIGKLDHRLQIWEVQKTYVF
jgi:phosphoribosylpyrophosphate synthetase